MNFVYAVKLLCILVVVQESLATIEYYKDRRFEGLELKRGRIFSIQRGDIKIHTYEATLLESHNTHIVETCNVLVVFETQFLLSDAEEALKVIQYLNKTIDRVLVTHASPDHWLPLEVYQNAGIDVYAVQEVYDDIKGTGAFVIAERKKNPSTASETPNQLTLPNKVQPKGIEYIDGVPFLFKNEAQTKWSNVMTVTLPVQRVFIASDFLFSNNNMFLGFGNFDTWWNKLAVNMNNPLIDLILFGHGWAQDYRSAVIGGNMAYLKYAKSLYKLYGPSDTASYKKALVTRYPNYGLIYVIDLTTDSLFKPKQGTPDNSWLVG